MIIVLKPDISKKDEQAVLEEIKNARVFAGIHFRSATDDGEALGVSVGHFVLEHAMQRVNR